ncbi:MAG: UDP-N-acetylglucosamine 1-carboxyvinyltransferase, partial [Pseudomonadota bacterium]
MDKLLIRGGNRLSGTIPISGAKNAALTLIPCALLTEEPVTLRNLPRLADIDGFQHLMNQFGVTTAIQGTRPEDFGRTMRLEATRITSTVAPYDLVRKMRASILVLGPMLARSGEATVSMPGGCAIGNRPIDLHLKALEAFGAEIELAQGYVKAMQPDGGMPGGEFDFPVVSVGATENAVMAAVLANGTCRLFNAAREPEIVDLCNLLVAMGAEIEGIGTSDLTIHGVKRLNGATYKVMPDRIEAGSYACAAAITGGDVRLEGASAHDMASTLHALQSIGLHVEEDRKGVTVAANGALRPTDLTTAPFPGLATDMQAQLMSLLCTLVPCALHKRLI